MDLLTHSDHPVLNALLDQHFQVDWCKEGLDIVASVTGPGDSKPQQYSLSDFTNNIALTKLSTLVRFWLKDKPAGHVLRSGRENRSIASTYEMWVSTFDCPLPATPSAFWLQPRKLFMLKKWDTETKTAIAGLEYFVVEKLTLDSLADSISYTCSEVVEFLDVPFEYFEKSIPGSVAKITNGFSLGLTSRELVSLSFVLGAKQSAAPLYGDVPLSLPGNLAEFS